VSPKRGDRAAPPPVDDEWEIRFAASDAAKGWDELCRHAASNTCAAWLLLRDEPRPRVTARRGPLKYDLAVKVIDGRSCEQWQIEVTGAGRIWYAIDDERRTVWITLARVGHPPQTSKSARAGR
jgi:hypothetical protein